MNFNRKDYIIHVPQCLLGMNKRVKNFCKRRAECFHRFFIIVLTEHGQWLASFTPEKSTDKPRLVYWSRFYGSFQVPQKNLGSHTCANSVYQALSPIFRAPGNETKNSLCSFLLLCCLQMSFLGEGAELLLGQALAQMGITFSLVSRVAIRPKVLFRNTFPISAMTS